MTEFVELPFETEPIAPNEMCFAHARNLIKAIENLAFVACRETLKSKKSDEYKEIVIFEVDVERPQQVYHPVKHRERLAAVFTEDKDSIPEVLALRADFPCVPHLNLRSFEKPRSLCLYEQDPRDVMLYWTPLAFLCRIRNWLALTANGELHAQDQPLEPLLPYNWGTLILHRDVLTRLFNVKAHLPVCALRLTGKDDPELVAVAKAPEASSDQKPDFVVLGFMGQPVTHGIIRRQPTNVKELCELAHGLGVDFLTKLRSSLRTIADTSETEQYAETHPIIILGLPKARTNGAEPEDTEFWAFMVNNTLSRTGQELGVWDIANGQIGTLLYYDQTRQGGELPVWPLKILRSFTRPEAATLSGNQADARKMVMIGAGALGSEVINNLLRAGIGRWTIVDHDRLLPHNLARHVLGGHFLGQNKAEMMCLLANWLLDEAKPCASIPADVFCPGNDKERLDTALNQAEVIMDASASISLARHLALDIESSAPRISLFFTPSGNASVMLAEDKQRQVPLDMLEMQYCRAVANSDDLANHFETLGQSIRYSQSCRDLTSRVPQDKVSLHASLCTNALKKVLAEHKEFSGVWTLYPPYYSVSFTLIQSSKLVEEYHDPWRIRTDDWFLEKLKSLRNEKLPNETGGIILGSHDMKRGIIYLVDTVPSPSDSQEWPTVYIRGKNGLSSTLQCIESRTNGHLTYVGEWHSHPDGVLVRPSIEDKKAFDWLSSEMQATGLPPVMAIVGQNDIQIYAASMHMEEHKG